MGLRRLYPILLVGIFFAIYPLIAGDEVLISLTKQQSVKGGTWQSVDGQFSWRLLKESLRNETQIKVRKLPEMGFDAQTLTTPTENTIVLALNPAGHHRLTPVYGFDVVNAPVYDRQKVSVLTLSNPSPDDGMRKRLFVFDSKDLKWNPLDPLQETVKGKVSGYTNAPSGMVALFGVDPMMEGKASWYKYKGCDCAASPDFPKGTKLNVTNLDNGKRVTITVNDWGPDRAIHPERAIDLDVVAFKKIASTRAGIINVKIEKVSP